MRPLALLSLLALGCSSSPTIIIVNLGADGGPVDQDATVSDTGAADSGEAGDDGGSDDGAAADAGPEADPGLPFGASCLEGGLAACGTFHGAHGDHPLECVGNLCEWRCSCPSLTDHADCDAGGGDCCDSDAAGGFNPYCVP